MSFITANIFIHKLKKNIVLLVGNKLESCLNLADLGLHPHQSDVLKFKGFFPPFCQCNPCKNLFYCFQTTKEQIMQYAHPCSLITTFIVCCRYRIIAYIHALIYRAARLEAVQAGLCFGIG